MSGRKVLLLLLSAVSLCCFAWARELALGLDAMEDLRLFTLEESFPLSGRAARTMLEQEAKEERPLSFAVWKELSAQSVENPDLGRFSQAPVLLAAGNSELVFPSDVPLPAGDREGCLIDPSTAQALFGSSRPIGCLVLWNGRELTVRGILKSERPLLLVPCDPQEQGLDHISLRLPKDALPPSQILSEFTSRHGLSGRWDGASGWISLAGFCSLLPSLVLFTGVLLKSIKTALAAQEYPVVFLVCLLAAGAVWFLGIWSTEFSLEIPTEALPGKWSDFEFWTRLLETKKEELLLLLSSSKTQPELVWLLPALTACGTGILGSLLALGSLMRVRPQSGLELWLCCAGSIALCFLLSLWLGENLARDRALWTAPLLFLPAQYAQDRLTEWAREITNQSSI